MRKKILPTFLVACAIAFLWIGHDKKKATQKKAVETAGLFVSVAAISLMINAKP